MEYKGRVAVVTGANSGIGLAVAEHLSNLGMIVIGFDRDIDKLKENKKLHSYKVDLTNEQEVTKAFQWTDEVHGGVDILINNAGLGGATAILECKVPEWKKIMDVNLIAMAQCSVEAVKSMQRRKITHGQIIITVSAMGTFMPDYAPFHFYSISKHAARAFVFGLRMELMDSNIPIRVTSINPGLVRTNIFKSSIGQEVDNFLYNQLPSLNPQDIANTIEYIINTPRTVNIDEIFIKPAGANEKNLTKCFCATNGKDALKQNTEE